ncbi:hypothetical protein CHS0354_003794 [Potamilus streckersoni]|uniref:Uncharacterized protein n=1 Tax=Potamilus streckersoni TaxID=2493646 RepID=A0AAE0T2C9_9BIVA|nr:hypothetical protein CHS0354_003794 [Potamilus streckersoni]
MFEFQITLKQYEEIIEFADAAMDLKAASLYKQSRQHQPPIAQPWRQCCLLRQPLRGNSCMKTLQLFKATSGTKILVEASTNSNLPNIVAPIATEEPAKLWRYERR